MGEREDYAPDAADGPEFVDGEEAEGRAGGTPESGPCEAGTAADARADVVVVTEKPCGAVWNGACGIGTCGDRLASS